MNESDISKAINTIAVEIIANNKDIKKVAIIGILQRGGPLAERIAAVIEQKEKVKVKVGTIDVSFYRDDLSVRGNKIVPKKSNIMFSIENKTVILVDDVLYKGRTTRAALDSLNDYGRAAKIELAVLVDRGGRELPVQPDYCGKKVSLTSSEDVLVHLTECDKEDKVIIK